MKLQLFAFETHSLIEPIDAVLDESALNSNNLGSIFWRIRYCGGSGPEPELLVLRVIDYDDDSDYVTPFQRRIFFRGVSGSARSSGIAPTGG